MFLSLLPFGTTQPSSARASQRQNKTGFFTTIFESLRNNAFTGPSRLTDSDRHFLTQSFTSA